MKTWITAGTHFNHEMLVNKRLRPSGFNELIIERWNELVKPEDLVIHLGDVILGKNSQIKEILKSLNGTKILVKGNHDNENYAWYMHRGFNFVCDRFDWFYAGLDLIFTHRPVAYAIAYDKDCNIHGHLHNNFHRVTENWDNPDFNILVSLEQNDYKPILLDTILWNATTNQGKRK